MAIYTVVYRVLLSHMQPAPQRTCLCRPSCIALNALAAGYFADWFGIDGTVKAPTNADRKFLENSHQVTQRLHELMKMLSIENLNSFTDASNFLPHKDFKKELTERSWVPACLERLLGEAVFPDAAVLVELQVSSLLSVLTDA